MTTSIAAPVRDCVNSLGIPVDNLSLHTAIERIVGMAQNRDGNARLVSTLNVDFLVNSLACRFTRPRHPELLNVLRTSDMVTADGFPIVWLSNIVGKPLAQRVAGSDMVPELARRATQENLSIFLLGGGEGVAADAARVLQEANPGLHIAGSTAPYIHTAGPALTESASADEALLEKINGSGADILLVGLGNPKQELWFNRNRHKLTVPVSIGVGGTFEFITGTVKRAPAWIQRFNMEWLYRITQDPGRLWHRYAKGLFKLGVLSAPLFYYRALEATVYRAVKRPVEPRLKWRSVWSSRENSLSILRLPALLGRVDLEQVTRDLQQTESVDALRILDFSQVKHVELAAHQEFFALSQLLGDPVHPISIMGMSDRLRRHLAACRIQDVLGESEKGDSLHELSRTDSAVHTQAPNLSSYVIDNSSLIFLSGKVDGDWLQSLGFLECLQHTARDRVCIIDFRKVSLLETSAIAALHPVFAAAAAGGGTILLSGAGPGIRQMFRMAELGKPANFIEDRELLVRITNGDRSDD